MALSVNLLTRMAIEVRINNCQSAMFVIDTGAERTVLSDELARAMALPSGPRVLVHGVTSDRLTETVLVETLDYGDRRFQALVTPVFSRADLGADGLIGLDTLGQFELRIDFISRRVVLRPRAEALIAYNREEARAGRLGQTAMPATRGHFGQLLLPTEVEGVAVEAFVDSGAEYSIGNRALQTALGRTGSPGLSRPMPVILGVSGTRLTAESRTVSSLRLARRSLGETPLLFADLNVFDVLGLQTRPALLLGADILTRFETLALDYARARILLGRVRQRRPPTGN